MDLDNDQWINVKDLPAPKDRSIIVRTHEGNAIVVKYEDIYWRIVGCKPFFTCPYYCNVKFDYWMPLPPPPNFAQNTE